MVGFVDKPVTPALAPPDLKPVSAPDVKPDIKPATKPVPKRRVSWRRRTLNALGSLFLAAGTGAIGLGVGLSISMEQSTSIAPLGSSSEISLSSGIEQLDIEQLELWGDLQPFVDYLDSPEYKAQQEIARLERIEQSKEILANAQVESDSIITGANKKAEAVAIEANYAIANYRNHAPEGEPAQLQFDAQVISSTPTATGCDVTIRNTQTDQRSLITNLAAGSCVSPGQYKEGQAIGRYGRYAAGIRNYSR